MAVSARLRKLTLIIHIVCSVGWVGALAAFLVLAAVGIANADEFVVRSVYIAADLITGYAILPLALAAVATGITQALITPWGLFRSYWVVFKLAIVVTATAMLVEKTGAIGFIADMAAQGAISAPQLVGLQFSMLGHAVGGIVALLWAATLGMLKPKALTLWGRRKLREQRA